MRILGSLVFMAGLLLCGPAGADTGPCTIERVAGTSDSSRFDGVVATEAELLRPSDFDIGPDGLLYILDSGTQTILRVNSAGRLEVFAGNGDHGTRGDGGPAKDASLVTPQSMRFAPDGSLYVLDQTFREYTIRRVRPDGTIETFLELEGPGKYGLGDTLEEMGMLRINSFDIGPDGSLFLSSVVLDRIFRIAPSGTASVIAGNNSLPSSGGYSGDGGPAIDAQLDAPGRITVGPDGIIYFIDGPSGQERIRRVLPDGTIETFMTYGAPAIPGALRTESTYRTNQQLSIDSQGRLMWLEKDEGGYVIKRIGTDDRIEVVASLGEISPWRYPLIAEDGIYVLTGWQVFRVPSGGGELEAATG